MKGNEMKQAHYLSLINAGAFIQSHGEEGGIEQEDYEVDIDLYVKENQKVAEMLYKMAAKYKQKHNL